MCAAHHKLDNLCAIIDYNKLQSDARNDAIMRLEPLAAKWRAFDWAVAEIDGHDIRAHSLDLPPRRRDTRSPQRDHRTHGQGQGRSLYGKHSGLARQREAHPRTGRRSFAGARLPHQQIKEYLDATVG